MALTKVLEGGIADDAVGNTKLDLGEDYTFTGTIVGAGGNNTPYFYGQKASNQTITRNTSTKVTGFTTAELDSDSAFDGTTFTVPSGKAGRYYFHANLISDFSAVGSDGERAFIKFYKNGSSSNQPQHEFFKSGGYNISQVSNAFSVLMDLSASDYVEIYVYNKDGDAGGNARVTTLSNILGYRLA